jgi:hypothetical protein
MAISNIQRTSVLYSVSMTVFKDTVKQMMFRQVLAPISKNRRYAILPVR